MKLVLRTNTKEYTAETIDFSFGVIEDILDALDLEHMNSKIEIATMIIKTSKQLRPFLKEIFPGVTDEEIRAVKMSNLIEIFRGLYNYATVELAGAAGGAKN